MTAEKDEWESDQELKREAELLRAMLDGEDIEIDSGDLEAIGLLRQAAGTPAMAQGATDRAWERIRRARPVRRRAVWAWAGTALAASIAVFVLMRAPATPPLPQGASASERQAAMAALDPSSGPPAERLLALRTVAASERERLVAELSHAD